jgi:hypothetical protein
MAASVLARVWQLRDWAKASLASSIAIAAAQTANTAWMRSFDALPVVGTTEPFGMSG